MVFFWYLDDEVYRVCFAQHFIVFCMLISQSSSKLSYHFIVSVHQSVIIVSFNPLFLGVFCFCALICMSAYISVSAYPRLSTCSTAPPPLPLVRP